MPPSTICNSKKSRMTSANSSEKSNSPFKFKNSEHSDLSGVTNFPATCLKSALNTVAGAVKGQNGSKMGPKLDFSKAGLPRGQGDNTHVYEGLQHNLATDKILPFHTHATPLQCNTVTHSVILSQLNDTQIRNNCQIGHHQSSTDGLIPFTHPTLPIIQIQVNGKNIYGLVDSGSTSCLLASYLFNEMYRDKPPLLQQISTTFVDCQGKNLNIVGLLKNANLGIGPLKIHHDIIIFESQARDFLIGFDLIRKLQLGITSQGLRWTLHYQSGQVRAAQYSSSIIPLFPVQKYTILENEQIMIMVKASLENTPYTLQDLLSNCWTCSSEYLQENTDFADLNIFFQYVQFHQNGVTKLLFKNKGNICQLSRNEQIATAELVQICEPRQGGVDRSNMFANSIQTQADSPKLVDKINKQIQNPGTLINLASGTLINRASNIPLQNGHQKLTKLAPIAAQGKQEMEWLSNPFQEICQIARQFDSVTEQEIADRLSKIEQSFEPTTINICDINCQSTNPLHKKFITELVLQNKHLFSKHSWDVGRLNASEISLQVKSGVHPVAEKSYPVPAKYMASARKLIQKMMDMGVIVEGESPWESPLIFVKKKPPEKAQQQGQVGLQAASMHGTITEDHLRLVYDARSLNKCIRRTYTAYQLPKCQDLIHYFRNNKFAGVCDITAAFFTHVLSKNTMKLFSFSFDDKKYLYKRLPMGFIGSTNLFQAHITKVLHENGLHRYKAYPDGSHEGAAAYLDNVLIFARTEETYKILLRKFFEAMSKANYRLKLAKCHFFLVNNFVIFGMELSLPFSTIQPEKKKVEQILSIPIPSTRRKTRSFIGSASYFSKICPKLQIIMGPLYELTSEKTRFLWTERHTIAFEATKRALARYPMIHLFDPSQPLLIYTDSCVREYAAYIGYQKDNRTNTLVPVIVGSHRFTTSESHYSQYQSELYSLVLFITKHYNLIYGTKLYFLTDCKSIQFGVKFKELNSTILRWWLLISTLDFTIIFTPATDCLIQLTDLLTRRNNTIKKTNKRLTEQDFAKLQFIDFFNIPPLTLQEIEVICKKFNQWIENDGKKPSSPPAKVTSRKSQKGKQKGLNIKAPTVKHINTVTAIRIPASVKRASIKSHKSSSHARQPSPQTKGTSMKSAPTTFTRGQDHPGTAPTTMIGATFVNFPEKEKSSTIEAKFINSTNGGKVAPTKEADTKNDSGHNAPGVYTISKHVHPANDFPELPRITFMVNQKRISISPDLKVTDGAIANHEEFASMEYIFNKDHIIPILQTYLPDTSLAQLIKYQSLDKKLKSIMAKEALGQNSGKYSILKGVLCIKGQISLRNQDLHIFRIMCPSKLVHELFQCNHVHGYLHLGYRKLMQFLNQAWNVPSPKNCYIDFIQHCQHCLINIKNPVTKIPQGVSLCTKPRQTVSLDVCTVQSNFLTYNSFLCIVDIFSLFVCAIPCDKNLTALQAAKLYFAHYYQCWGPAMYILRDNAKSFVASDFNILLRLTGCLPVTLTSYQSTANSAVEYLNKYITLSLRAMHQISPLREEYMHFYLSIAALSWNSLPNSKTGFSPSFIMTGQSKSPYQRRVMPTKNMTLPSSHEQFLKQVILFYEVLFQVHLKAKNAQIKATGNQTFQRQFNVGDYVLIQKAPLRNNGPGWKLRPRFHKELFRIQKTGTVSAHLILIGDKFHLEKYYKGHGFYLSQKVVKVQYTRLKKVRNPFQYLDALQPRIQEIYAISQKAQMVDRVFLSNAPLESSQDKDPELMNILHCIGNTPTLPAAKCIKNQLKIQGLFTAKNLHKIPSYYCCWVKSGLIFSKPPSSSRGEFSSQDFQWSKLDFDKFQRNPEKFKKLFHEIPPLDETKFNHMTRNFWKTNYFWNKKMSNWDSDSHLTVASLGRTQVLPATLHALPGEQPNHHDPDDNDNVDNDDDDTDDEEDNTDDNDDDTPNSDDNDNGNDIDDSSNHDPSDGVNKGKQDNEDNDSDDDDSLDPADDNDPGDDQGHDSDGFHSADEDNPSSPAHVWDSSTPRRRTPHRQVQSPSLRLPHSPAIHIDDVHIQPLETEKVSPGERTTREETAAGEEGRCQADISPSRSTRKTLKLASSKMSLRKNPTKSEAFYRSLSFK